ncbi:zinc finger CCCH domain-containing protein 67-like isoform X1 [Pyrus communis]|uniref:zinc finger CCCH domain-containing protein 67-like isoform X1 n=2 Tax=Pyrus communis TaxID=23211 RepID=UPI0035C1E4FF
MAISEAISLVPPDPETPSTSHAHSDQGFLPSSPDPALAPSGVDHAVLDEKLDLKEEGEDDGEPDEVQKLDSIEKVEEDEAGELQKVDLKAEDEAGELQKVDLKAEDGAGELQKVEFYEGVEVPLNPTSVPSPARSDLVPEIFDWIRTLDPPVLNRIRNGDPALLHEIQQFDPAVEIRNFELSIVDEIRNFDRAFPSDLKAEEGGEGVEEEEKSYGAQEVEIVNGEKNERQSEQSEQSDGGEGWGGNQGWEEDGGGVEEKKAVETQESNRRYQYPVRPEAEDCSYYLKTGSCKFGSNCKFNHPVRRKPNQVPKERVKDKDESAENPSQTECKYYLRSGGCKYGENCRYSHSREKPSVAPVLELNFLGLPIRPGERECPYYMRNGSCKYASNCRFNHPDPTTTGGSNPPSGYGNGGPASLQGASQSTVAPWSAPRPLNEAPVYSTLMIPPPQVVSSQNSEWNGYQAPAYVPERSMPARPPYMMNNSVAETNIYKQYPHQNQVEEFPERPGQPICNYFLRTGDCKFKSNCKYHHPKNHTAVAPPVIFSDKGLPLRPDQNICTHYSRYGICKFGPTCKFDHPLRISSSTTSGPDHRLPFSDSATTNGAGMAGSRNGTDVTSQPQPVQ